MKKLRFAIVGTGIIAEVHATALNECYNAALTAVFDQDCERASEFATRHGARAETTLDGLLACGDVDVVSITTPSGSRMEIALTAAGAKKHVLVEKPMEVTPERAQRIIDACRENGVELGCIFQARTGRNVQLIRRALEAGRFGKLIMAGAQVPWFRSQDYYDSAGWRGTWKLDGGGAMMNQSIHIIDLLCYLMGKPATVCGMTDTLTHKIEVEDTAAAVVRFQNHSMATIAASTSCGLGFSRRLEIYGECGSAVLEDDRLTRWSFVDERDQDEKIRRDGAQGDNLKSGHFDPKAIGHEGHRCLIEDFTRAIRSGERPMIPGSEGIEAIKLICGIYESARTGRLYHFDSGQGSID